MEDEIMAQALENAKADLPAARQRARAALDAMHERNARRVLRDLAKDLELRTPTEWAELRGIVILDPDGWRTKDAPRFDEPISLNEFTERVTVSTCLNKVFRSE